MKMDRDAALSMIKIAAHNEDLDDDERGTALQAVCQLVDELLKATEANKPPTWAEHIKDAVEKKERRCDHCGCRVGEDGRVRNPVKRLPGYSYSGCSVCGSVNSIAGPYDVSEASTPPCDHDFPQRGDKCVGCGQRVSESEKPKEAST